jgi:phytol kinase
MNTVPCQWNKCAEDGVCQPRPFEREFVRKMLHLPVFIFPLIAIYSVVTAIAALVLLAFTYITTLAYEKRFNKTVPLFSTIIASCRRNTACDFGPFYLAIGMVVALSVSSPNNVFFAAYVIAICDSAASLVGINFGKNKIPLFGKSYIGSLTFFVLCFIGGLYFFPPIPLLISALVLTVIELVSIKGLDNLTLPIAAQLLLLFLG